MNYSIKVFGPIFWATWSCRRWRVHVVGKRRDHVVNDVIASSTRLLYVIYGESWRHMTTWLSRLLRNWIDLVWDITCLPYEKLSSHFSIVDNWKFSVAVIVYLLGPLKNYYNPYNCLVCWELLGFSYFPNSPKINKYFDGTTHCG